MENAEEPRRPPPPPQNPSLINDPPPPPFPIPIPISYKLELKCPFGLFPAQCILRQDSPPGGHSLEGEHHFEIWDRRVTENPSLFNGKKFRYGGHVLYKHGDSNQVSHVCLQLGLTEYRTLVGTNLNPLWEKFLVPSEAWTSDSLVD